VCESVKTTTPDVVACTRLATNLFASALRTGRGMRESVKTKIKMMGWSGRATPHLVGGPEENGRWRLTTEDRCLR
jgi:hypothetical protein